jgi:Acetyltransferase (GNAT) domain
LSDDFQVRGYASADAPAVLELLQAAHGDWPGRRVAAHERPEDLFLWKHERSPYGPSQIVLAEDGGRLIGMRAYMDWPLDVDGLRVDAVHAVDAAILPGRKASEIDSALTEQALATLRATKQLAFGLEAGPNWHRVGRLRPWVRVRRPFRVTRRLRELGSPGRSLVVPSFEAPLAGAVLVDADANAVAELLHQPRPSGPHLATRTGVEYLRWRYEPLLADYRAVAEYQGNALIGMAIFGLRQRGELWEGSICELLVRPGDRRTAARLVRQIVRAAPFDYLAAAPAAGTGHEGVLRRAGFVPAPAGGRPLGVDLYAERVRPDPRQLGSWSLSFGDLERLDLC